MRIISIIVIVLCCFENAWGNTCSHHEKGSLSSCYNKGTYIHLIENKIQPMNLLNMRNCIKLLKGRLYINEKGFLLKCVMITAKLLLHDVACRGALLII